MTDQLQPVIERAWEERDSVGPDTKGEVRQAVDTALAALDRGQVGGGRVRGPGLSEGKREKETGEGRRGASPCETACRRPAGANPRES